MSLAAIRAALETAAMAVSPALDTVFETGDFRLASGGPYPGDYKPVAGRPYQLFYLLPADPVDYGLASGSMEQGLFQVTLRYPIKGGTRAAADRAELIRAAFARNTRLTAGGVTVKIGRTPRVTFGQVDGDRWSVVVRIPYTDR